MNNKSICDNVFYLHEYEDGEFHIGHKNPRMDIDELFCCQDCFNKLKEVIKKAERHHKKKVRK